MSTEQKKEDTEELIKKTAMQLFFGKTISKPQLRKLLMLQELIELLSIIILDHGTIFSRLFSKKP